MGKNNRKRVEVGKYSKYKNKSTEESSNSIYKMIADLQPKCGKLSLL